MLAGLRVAKRRADWRLGRWTAKRAVAAVARIAAERRRDPGRGRRRAGGVGRRRPGSPCRSRSATARAARWRRWPARRPRSAATWSWSSRAAAPSCASGSPTPSRRCSPRATRLEHARLANLALGRQGGGRQGAARGAAARRPPRCVELDAGTAAPGSAARLGWRPLRVVWEDAEPTEGWWRAEPDWVMVIAVTGEAAPEPPRRAAARSSDWHPRPPARSSPRTP